MWPSVQPHFLFSLSLSLMFVLLRHVSANLKFKEIELCHVLFLVCFVSSFCFWCFCFGLNGQLNICLVFLHLFHDVPHRFLHPHFNYVSSSSSRKVREKKNLFFSSVSINVFSCIFCSMVYRKHLSFIVS